MNTYPLQTIAARIYDEHPHLFKDKPKGLERSFQAAPVIVHTQLVGEKKPRSGQTPLRSQT